MVGTPLKIFRSFFCLWGPRGGSEKPDSEIIHALGGVGNVTEPLRIDVGIDKIRDSLMSRIDNTDPVEVEKVGRYLKHIEMYRRMERTVKKEGVSVKTENGSQTFVKSHPLLNEMNKINASLLSIEKSFNFIDNEEEHSAEDLL